MKNVLIIFYDLTDPAQNREAVVQRIKSLGKVARLGDSAYLVLTDAEPKAVLDKLMRLLDDNDRAFVGVAPAPSAWYGMPESVSKWILSNQE
jgi:hypothetical protein